MNQNNSHRLAYILFVVGVFCSIVAAWAQANASMILFIQSVSVNLGASIIVAAFTVYLVPRMQMVPDIEAIHTFLRGHFPSALADEIYTQLLRSKLIRDQVKWTLKLRVARDNVVRIDAELVYNLRNVGESTETSRIVYHLPSIALEGSCIREVVIGEEGSIESSAGVGQLAAMSQSGAFGRYFEMPITVYSKQTKSVLIRCEEYFQESGDVLLVSYIPALSFSVRVELDYSTDGMIDIISEYYHPADSNWRAAKKVGKTESGVSFMEFDTKGPCLPYQGVRIYWRFKNVPVARPREQSNVIQSDTPLNDFAPSR